MKTPKKTREQAIRELKSRGIGLDWFELSSEAKITAVENAKPCSEWINIMSGKVVRLVSRRWSGVTIRHERENVTIKGCRYFAYDYCPSP